MAIPNLIVPLIFQSGVDAHSCCQSKQLVNLVVLV
jgi:hypothetical protein